MKDYEQFKLLEDKTWEKSSYQRTATKDEDPVNCIGTENILLNSQEGEKVKEISGKNCVEGMIRSRYPDLWQSEPIRCEEGCCIFIEQECFAKKKNTTKIRAYSNS